MGNALFVVWRESLEAFLIAGILYAWLKGNDDSGRGQQALFIGLAAGAGLAVLLGCAHAGVVNTLEHIRHVAPSQRIHAVLGGMHLVHASDIRIQRTLEAFRCLGIDRIGPAHCTGWHAARQIWNAVGEECFLCCVGTQVSF